MNSLQNLPSQNDYFLSINDPGKVREEKVLRTFEYEHPVFSPAAIRAQRDLPALNTDGTLYFCGSYFRYGFHEDAFTSALHLARALTGERLWE